MWWMMFAGAAKGLLEASANKELNDINNGLQKAFVQSNRSKSAASNIASSAQGNLARWAQSVNNQRVLEAGGKSLEVNAINFGRQMDAALSSGFSTSIGAAEVAGRAAVASGFAGISGDVVDAVNVSTRIRDRMVREQTQANYKMAEWDFRQKQATIATQTIRSMDSSYLMDTLDFSMGYTQQQWSPSLAQGAFAGAAPYMQQAFSNWGSSNSGSFVQASNYTDSSNAELAQQFNFG